MIRRWFILWALTCAGCQPDATPPAPAPSEPARESIDEPLQPLPVKIDLDVRKVALGEQLFSFPLSHEGKLSCASCHPPEHAFADGVAHSLKEKGATLVNTPTVLNTVFDFRYNWNGAYESLEDELDAP